MNLAHPERLYLLVLVPALALFLWVAAVQARKAVARFGSPDLLQRAGMAVSGRMRALKAALMLAAVALIVFSLAGPRWGASREKIERKGVDVVVALDTSMSMLAEDVAPSRMARAKQAIEKLIDLMQGDRIGIVVFAGSAFTMCPLTLDYSAARMFLDVIDTHSVPEPGTNIAEALEEAAKNFTEGSDKHKVIILISDGEDIGGKDQADPVKTAEDLAGQGVVIYTVGVGAAKGASIPMETPQGRLDKTYKGEVVLTRLDENTMRKITLAGSGKYRRLDNSASGDELADIYAGVAGMEKKTFEEMYQIHYEDRFQWFVGAALVLLAIEAVLPDRRRKP